MLPHADIIITLHHLVINKKKSPKEKKKINKWKGRQKKNNIKERQRWGNDTNVQFISWETRSLVKLSRSRLFAESDTCCRVVLFIIESFRTSPPSLVFSTFNQFSGEIAWDTQTRSIKTLCCEMAQPLSSTCSAFRWESLRRIIKVNRSAHSPVFPPGTL